MRGAALLACLLLANACGTAPDPSSHSFETASPTPGPTCLNIGAEVDSAPETMANLAAFSSAVVVGRFDGEDPAQWNTRSGERPRGSSNLGVLIFRPIRITLTTVLRGAPGAVLGARVEGGDIGCDSNHLSNELRLGAGARYVFFLQPEWDPANARSLNPWVLAAWPLEPDGSVLSPLEGDLPIATLRHVLATTPVRPLPTAGPLPSPSR